MANPEAGASEYFNVQYLFSSAQQMKTRGARSAERRVAHIVRAEWGDVPCQ
ncbi:MULTISPECIES: hypothetical protein [unclassified Sphingopyxis]|uniref:hypothetical protein n=1 Tax=unclassified Sphingopyxis TaxID=2614943 RepID=UPI0021E51707|nr:MULTISPECIES: hypothetical protein [unclassified Sphingopyxis]